MKVFTDDELHRVDEHWLGPDNFTLPWTATYGQYALWLVYFLGVNAIGRRFGIDVSFFSLAWSILISVALVMLTGRVVNRDRSVGSVLAAFSNEVGAPRPKKNRARAWHVAPRHVRGEIRRETTSKPDY